MSNENIKYETGATSHAVNDLILFTDNTRELAELRDKIYQARYKYDVEIKNYTGAITAIPPKKIDLISQFSMLRKKAQEYYKKELGAPNSEHITRMGNDKCMEFVNLYISDFDNWKKENGYK